MRRALLDVNVLLALLDLDHVNHTQAKDWLRREAAGGWASCPITENGYVRIATQPRYPNPTTTPDAVSRLRDATGSRFHEFWPCDVSLLDGMVDATRLSSSAQVTDAYLLALAAQRGGRFVAFDQRIALTAVPGAGPKNLHIIGA